LDVRRRLLGVEHPFTLGSMSNLADVYALCAKYARAEALFQKAIEIGGRKLGAENNYTLTFLSSFASMYLRQGNYALAETYGAGAVWTAPCAGFRGRANDVHRGGFGGNVYR
jgi:tetratricopeptide (TPR) repeat protein